MVKTKVKFVFKNKKDFLKSQVKFKNKLKKIGVTKRNIESTIEQLKKTKTTSPFNANIILNE